MQKVSDKSFNNAPYKPYYLDIFTIFLLNKLKQLAIKTLIAVIATKIGFMYKFFWCSGLFFLRTGVTTANFTLLGNFPLFSAGWKRCCNVSAVTIALVFNTFGGIFLWVLAFLSFTFFLSLSILVDNFQ